MTKHSLKTLLWMALPIALASGCAHTDSDGPAAFNSIQPAPMSPTSDRAEPRVYGEMAPPADQFAPPPGASTGDWQLAEELRYMFTTNRTLASSPVAGTVSKGMVTLRGNVATQTERDKVHAAVAGLPGMDQLDDQIIVQNPAVSWKGENRDY
jgi:hypothetical protein